MSNSENYREVDLLGYLPTYLQSYNEFKVLANVEEPEIESLFNELQVVRNNQFINSCDEVGIEKFEKLLDIGVNKNDALETRKARVLVKWLQDIPYTYETLGTQLSSLCGVDGFEMTLDNEKYYLEVLVRLVAKERLEDVKALLGRVAPCNLDINTFIDYNRHEKFKPFMYKEIGKFSYNDLREKIIDVDEYLNRNNRYNEVTYLETKELSYDELRRNGDWYIG